MGIGSKAEAAEFWNLNQASVFIKQGRSDTCILASAVMMVRRAAMASGNANWASITENSMRSTAWLEGSGLYYNFTYAGISVKHGTLAGRDHVISLLNQHPEGIVIYNTSKPHAILLTDYTEGIFFCADPANNTIAGRIPIASAAITLDSASQYWYVDSPKITLGSANNTVTFDSEVVNGISYNSAKISTWARFHMEYEVANYTKLPAGSTIYYQFFVVNGGKEYKTSLNSFRTSDSSVSFDSEAITDISSDSAKISIWVSSSGTISEMGIRIGTTSSSLREIIVTRNVGWTRFHMQYDLSQYLMLSLATTYYYQFFIKKGRDNYQSPLRSFTTKAGTVGCDNHSYGWVIEKKATCSTTGSKYQKCSKCGARGITQTISKLSHVYTTVTKKATASANGVVAKKCTACGYVSSMTVIPSPQIILFHIHLGERKLESIILSLLSYLSCY